MKLNTSSIILMLLFLFISCEKETEFDMPTVFTGDVTNASQTQATFNAKIYNPKNIAILESGFIWGVHSKDNFDLKLVNPSSENIFSLQTDIQLLTGKTFYVRAFAKTDNTTIYGREVSFKTDSIPLNLGNWYKIIDSEDITIIILIQVLHTTVLHF